MTPMLAPLVGDAPTVTFIGLCKNAGKTTAMCRLMEELPGETLALTSVGRDGERTDVVTGTEKPEIWVRAGTLFATARGMLPLCDATLRVEAVTDVMTPLGAVGILRALSDGYIQLAGPSAVSQLGPLSRTFRALGAQRVLIDGAAGRRSLAGVEPGAAAILCVGASVDGGIPAIAAETAHICALFDAPEGDGPALRSALREEEGRYALIPALEGMEIQSMEESLNLLDPSGRRLPAFSVENAFAPALERVRAEKALVEGRLRQAEGTERDGLMACRRSLVERENQLELEARKGLTMSLLRQRESLLAAMEAVGRLDLLLAKARLARRFSCCRPEITKQPRVEAVDMVHPEAAAYLGERGGSFTAVSLTLERGTTVITGANMGGKSVSMKSLTLNLLLAQTGFFTFAGAFSAPLFHSVCLICTDRQSVEQGLSSFGAEMSALGAVLREEKDKFFYIALDEFARGTNPREGAALARALAEYLGRLNCVALMTTHYDGVSDAARRHYRVAGLGALDTAALHKDGAPLEHLSRLMDYHLIEAKPGEPCPRDALRVCRLLDLDPALMEIF